MTEKEILSNIQDAVKEQDSSKLKSALKDFKKWFFGGDPDAKHQNIKNLLAVLYILLNAGIGYISGMGIASTAFKIAEKAPKKSWISTLVTSLLALFGSVVANKAIIEECNKEQAKYIDQYIDKANKKLAELDAAIKEMDSSSKEYKEALKLKKAAESNLGWLTARKLVIDRSAKIKGAKDDLKAAKATKDKEAIRKAKDNYRIIKHSLIEAIETLEDSDDLAMNENAVLLKKAKALVEAVAAEYDYEDDNTVDNDTMDAVNEAIDMLYEKAIMCESADDAALYVKKAEELQKAIEDIPEETPVEDDEYPAEVVTGGKGIMDDDDIKDLVGGDDEALKLLTSDIGSSIIDA